MKNKKYFVILFAILAITLLVILSSCTQNQRAKSWGGKVDNLWYLTRPMREGEQVETYTFQEESSFGVLEGTYQITEMK
jgi:hypothetical protein